MPLAKLDRQSNEAAYLLPAFRTQCLLFILFCLYHRYFARFIPLSGSALNGKTLN